MNSNNRKIKVIVILLLVMAICISILIIAVYKRDLNNENNMIKEKMSGTSWPLEEVPILYKENMQVADDRYTCKISITAGVSYEELREYLIKVYNAGFKPNEDLGCKNPNNMTSTAENMEEKEVLWIGHKDKYQITVIWAEEGANNRFGDPYTFHFEITLYTEPVTGIITTTEDENVNSNEDGTNSENEEIITSSGSI